ncbi:hypothetical protein JL721_12136 [Aureococcus anophagefferens]|nr:hypothetical protein JL721_12136 [Aureococcus anophagefferens]
MNVCVGSTAFAFALYKHQKEHFEQLEDEREARFHKEYDLTLDRINATKPETLLDALSWYTRALEAEAKQAGWGVPDAWPGEDDHVSDLAEPRSRVAVAMSRAAKGGGNRYRRATMARPPGA